MKNLSICVITLHPLPLIAHLEQVPFIDGEFFFHLRCKAVDAATYLALLHPSRLSSFRQVSGSKQLSYRIEHK